MRRKRIRDAALYTFIVKQKWFEKISSPHIIRICLGVLRTLGLYINLHQSAMNDHPCYVLVHASPPQRAEAHLREEMFINGYALQTRQGKCPIKFQIPFG